MQTRFLQSVFTKELGLELSLCKVCSDAEGVGGGCWHLTRNFVVDEEPCAKSDVLGQVVQMHAGERTVCGLRSGGRRGGGGVVGITEQAACE